MQFFSSLAPTEESVPCSLYPKYLREAKNPRKSMKMRLHCQLAFATARLPCIQIRLPSRGGTEKDPFQTQLSFVTKGLCLKRGHSVHFWRGHSHTMAPLLTPCKTVKSSTNLPTAKTGTGSPWSPMHPTQRSANSRGPPSTDHIDRPRGVEPQRTKEHGLRGSGVCRFLGVELDNSTLLSVTLGTIHPIGLAVVSGLSLLRPRQVDF